MRKFCTIASVNYLPQVEVLLQSLKMYHPDINLHLLLIDIDLEQEISAENLVILAPNLICNPSALLSLRDKYDIVEFATAIKPMLLKHLLEDTDDLVIYLDPDIETYNSFEKIFDHVEEFGILLTPHKLIAGTEDRDCMSDLNRLEYGTFNLGFIGVSSRATAMLEWWGTRTRFASTRIPGDVVYTDQKWLDILPGYFKFGSLRNFGCNVAPWNLDERILSLRAEKIFVNNEPLIFFHFSQVKFLIKGGLIVKSRLIAYLKNIEGESFNIASKLTLNYLEHLQYYKLNGKIHKLIALNQIITFTRTSSLKKILIRSGIKSRTILSIANFFPSLKLFRVYSGVYLGVFSDIFSLSRKIKRILAEQKD